VHSLTVNPTPRFELSPRLFMQFMEPLGATDGSVEAAWDHLRDQWREGVGPRDLSYLNSGDVMKTVEKPLNKDSIWEFPTASVSAVELRLAT
jgi:hypothetical protein